MLSAEQTAALRAPFDPDEEIEWRVQRVNKNNSASLVAYVTARAIMDRMDSVFGVDGWSVDYRTIVLGKHEGFICRITTPGCTKEDISDLTDIEALKGGVSGSLKRCAVLFGIGRYLYDLGEEYAEIRDGRGPKGSISVKKPDGGYGWVARPQMPAWARPSKPVAAPAAPAPAAPVVPVVDREHDPSWTGGGNRKFMARFSEAFKVADGYDYGTLTDWLESINRPRPSQMTEAEREKLIGYIIGPGRAKFTAFVQQILKDRQEVQ